MMITNYQHWYCWLSYFKQLDDYDCLYVRDNKKRTDYEILLRREFKKISLWELSKKIKFMFMYNKYFDCNILYARSEYRFKYRYLLDPLIHPYFIFNSHG